jgi:protein-tyrosine-phosphatase
VADSRDVEELVGEIPTVGKRLMERCWPGPLTIIFNVRDGSTVGVRLPDHESARELIRRAHCPVLAPSANLAGEPPATTAEEVLAKFDGKIEGVLDAGPTQFGESSTVVRLVGNEYRVEREGALSSERLRRVMNTSILFVCSGNSCRSPIAEGFCRKMLARKVGVSPRELDEHGYEVASCGTRAIVGVQASIESQVAAGELGVDLSEHLSRPMTEKILKSADVIYVMTPEQMEQVQLLSPVTSGKVMLLDPKGRPIADPHGGDMETYRRCALTIQEALRKRLKDL